jgi:hypothetical protein
VLPPNIANCATFLDGSGCNPVKAGRAFNTALGDPSFNQSNTTGTGNTSVGSNSLYSNTTGFNNVAVGYNSLTFNAAGRDNTGVGFGAFWQLATGDQNTGVGSGAFYSTQTGSGNTALGTNAGFNLISGGGNLFLGVAAGTALLSGSGNIYIGTPGRGPISEDSTIRIGPATYPGQRRTFIDGISGVTTSLPAQPVVIDANGQLGTAGLGSAFLGVPVVVDSTGKVVGALSYSVSVSYVLVPGSGGHAMSLALKPNPQSAGASWENSLSGAEFLHTSTDCSGQRYMDAGQFVQTGVVDNSGTAYFVDQAQAATLTIASVERGVQSWSAPGGTCVLQINPSYVAPVISAPASNFGTPPFFSQIR